MSHSNPTLDEPIVLVSHALCPYVQRVAIVLHEKGMSFGRHDIELADKPAWFMQLSPLGRTPVLQVGREAIFESAVICEYLEETALPRLHPPQPLMRARHRAWIEFSSELLRQIAALYRAADEASLMGRTQELRARLAQLEPVVGAGPFFSGTGFCLVDATFAPVFRYFDVLDELLEEGFWDGLPSVRSWRVALSARTSVKAAVRPDYPVMLREFIQNRRSALSRRLDSRVTHESASRAV